ncbi:hypothetical protein [Halostella litorea]|uniref:hypothetical protein n=1 Tax=Halostella litorea TaxID=2528831 RepID=UPI001092E5F1|nr:hypothetical protein [Halostella litorea]
MDPPLDIDHFTRIEFGDAINDDEDDSDDGHYGRAVPRDHVIPVTVDPHAVLRDISAEDTITAVAYEDTHDALLTPAAEDGSVDIEAREWQTTFRFTADITIEQ